jgi:hypothetical protein
MKPSENHRSETDWRKYDQRFSRQQPKKADSAMKSIFRPMLTNFNEHIEKHFSLIRVSHDSLSNAIGFFATKQHLPRISTLRTTEAGFPWQTSHPLRT